LWGNYGDEDCEGINTAKSLPESCMKMVENLVNKEKKQVCAKLFSHTFCPKGRNQAIS
jgi:hypothetical protein